MSILQDWPAPSAPLPIVIIGAGGIVRDAHLPAYRKAGLAVAAVTDVDAGRATALAADWGIPTVHPSVAAAAAAHGTGVVYDVAVPPGAILSVLPDLPDGAAVLIQKPMGTDLATARAIRDLCRAKRLTSAINFQLRFSPMMMAARQMIEQGDLGDLLEVEVHLNIFTPWDLFPFLIPMERVEIAVHSIHYLDAIRALAGTPKGVFARTLRDPRQPDFAQTRTSVILDYDAPCGALCRSTTTIRAGANSSPRGSASKAPSGPRWSNWGSVSTTRAASRMSCGFARMAATGSRFR
jgi:predicted dehydrogenase